MPKLTNSLPKYRKKSVRKSVYAVVTLDGKDHYLGEYGSEASKAEYQRLTGQWQANGRRLPVEVGRDITITELIAEYWRFAKTYYVKNGKPTDELGCIKAALRHVRTLYEESNARDFGPLALASVRNRMIDAGNSRNYINKNVHRIRRMFKWGVSQQLIPVDCFQALASLDGLRKGKSNAVEKSPVNPVDMATIKATLKHCPQVVADMIRLQLMLGCRPGELFNLTRSEIDRSRDIWRYHPRSHKTEHQGCDRTILIRSPAQTILSPYLLRVSDSDSYCFKTKSGMPFRRWNYSDAINRACDKAFPVPDGLDEDAIKQWRKRHRWAPNRLRHTAGTDMRRTYGLEAAQIFLGHARANVTQVYAERDNSKLEAIMRELDASDAD